LRIVARRLSAFELNEKLIQSKRTFDQPSDENADLEPVHIRAEHAQGRLEYPFADQVDQSHVKFSDQNN
jgi:hypothetical protein